VASPFFVDERGYSAAPLNAKATAARRGEDAEVFGVMRRVAVAYG
jgi:hypothetical protein